MCLAGLASELTHKFNNVVHADHMRLRKQSAVGVDRQFSSKPNRSARNKRTALYLAGTPLLGDYLEEGLAELGLSCEEYEIGRL